MSDDHHEPAAGGGGDNPFVAPRAVDPVRREPRGGWTALRVIMFTLLGILLVPPAALICGFCCCTVGLGDGIGPPDFAFVVLFPLGAFIGAALAIAFVIWLARRTRRRADAAP